MTQLFRNRRLVAVTVVALVAGGFAAAACSSTERSPDGSEGNTQEPDPSRGTPGTGGSGTGQPPVTGGPGPVSSGGSEGLPPTGVPIDPGAGNGGAGSTTAPPTTPPPTSTLTPNCAAAEGAVPNLALAVVSDDLNQPLYVTGVPGDDSRLFVLEKGGAVRVILDGELQPEPFVTIPVNDGGERGLLGLAFHPEYATNGLLYVHYSAAGGAAGVTNGDAVVSELAVDPNNRSLALAGSQRNLIVEDDPESNHNGGQLSFGRDGFLYIGLGDGGGGNDGHGPIGNGQALDTLFGKLLRIDPLGRDVNGAYSIPAGNLAAQMNQEALGEIWAYGLRNPWRFSFDACTGDLYIGDVGQTTLEEIDYLPAATPAGTNFGWRIMEGPNCRPTDTVCPQADTSALTLPVDSYPRGIGTSVTGGYVYRGSGVPGLRGHYIYADYASARFFRFRIENGAMLDRVEITSQLRPGANNPIGGIASFGMDNAGEMYVAAFNPGAVYRITAAP